MEDGDKMTEISVIIPCYNVPEELLLRCVYSVLEQDFMDFEVLLIDDGSTEESKKALRKVCKLDNRICLFTQKNQGVSAARNTGVAAATGKFIVFVDADDVLLPYFLSEIYGIQMKTNADLVIGGNARLGKYSVNSDKMDTDAIQTEILTEERRKEFKSYAVGELYFFNKNEGYFGRGPWTRLLRREIALTTPFDTHLPMGEDIVWNLELLGKCKTICVAYRIWYLYYINSQSASRKYNEKMLENVRNELPCIEAQLDLNDNRQYVAYCCRTLDELMKIYNCYLGRKECMLNRTQRKELFQELYTRMPWKRVGEKRFQKLAGKKYKFKSWMYKHKCLFLFQKIMNTIGG